ncbi:MAG: thioredoxin TrxC [Acidimicrobiales bacterium]
MSDIKLCPSCGKQNRVPAAATGKPTCGACGASLPWIVEATDGSFDDTVATGVPVLVDLWAPWCGPCRVVTPILEDLARQRAGRLKVVKVNVDDSPQIAARYQVKGIPTLLLLNHGKLTARQTGALPGPALAQWLDVHSPGVS